MIPRSIGTNSAVISGGGIVFGAHPKLSVWNIVAHGGNGGWAFARRDDFPIVWNKRVHLAGTFVNNKLTTFVNGELIAVKGNVSYEGWDSDVFLGADQHHVEKGWVTGFFDGNIDEVRISNSARYISDFVPEQAFQADEDTLALYHVDEGSGTLLEDASGNGFHGTIHGATWSRREKSSRPAADFALDFDGIDDHVRVPMLHYEAGTPFTIEATVSDWWQDYGKICGWRDCANLSLGNGNTIGELTTADRKQHKWKQRLPNKESSKIALVYDGKQARLFVDGRSQLPLKLTDQPVASSSSTVNIGFTIGASPDGGSSFTVPLKARIDEVRVSKIARYTEGYTPKPRLKSDEHTTALFHFDEGEGTVLHDSSGNENHGTIYGASWIDKNSPAPPVRGLALRFDGVDDYVAIPSLKYLASKPFTIETTIADWGDGYGVICGWRACAAIDVSDRLLGAGLTTVDQQFDKAHKTRKPVERGIPLRVALVYDGKRAQLFVDGKAQSSIDLPAPLKPSESGMGKGFTIGSIPDRGNGFMAPVKARISEVRVSRIARYTENYTPKARLESDENTTALYHFDEGQGTVLNDSSGNGHHGTIHGARWLTADGSASSEELPRKDKSSNFALKFDGVDDYVDFVDAGGLHIEPDTPFTVEVTVRNWSNKVGQAICGWRGSAVLAAGGGGVNIAATTVGMSTVNEWQNVIASTPANVTRRLAMVYQKPTLRLFVDGKLENQTELKQSLQPTRHEVSTGFEIGGVTDKERGAAYLGNGIIDEVRVSSIARYSKDYEPESRFSNGF